jgi:hypothetical protein
VSDETWRTVHARLSRIKSQLNAAGHGRSRRSRDIDSKYLLSGFARCAKCGGTLSALSRNGGRSRFYAYGCLAHSKRGATVCANALVKKVERVEAAFIASLCDALRPAVLRALLDEVFAALRPETSAANVSALKKHLHGLDVKIAHLTAGVEEGRALAPLVRQLEVRQAEREELLVSIASAEAVTQREVDRRLIERKVLAQIATWREDLETNGRQVLRDILDGPVHYIPRGDTYLFEGNLRTGDLIAGLVGFPPFVARPGGLKTCGAHFRASPAG